MLPCIIFGTFTDTIKQSSEPGLELQAQNKEAALILYMTLIHVYMYTVSTRCIALSCLLLALFVLMSTSFKNVTRTALSTE